MKNIVVSVPTDGRIVIYRKRKVTDTAQTDLFGGYKSRWISDMAVFVRTLPRPVSMSTARIEAGKCGMAAPVDKSWYGAAMKCAKLQLIGYQKSIIKSRRGGVEAVWG